MSRSRRAGTIVVRCSKLLIAGVLATTGCRREPPAAGTTGSSSAMCGDAARQVAEELARRERLVSLLAPDSVVRRELADAYGDLVTPSLLADWQARPASAPGRQVSNPWPARLEITSMTGDSTGCRLEGEIIDVTTSDTLSPVDRRHVTMRITSQGGWRVSAYESVQARGVTGPAPHTDISPPADTTPADVVRRYYAAIGAGDYATAYALWGGGGQASGKSAREFAAGFARTARVAVAVTDSTRLEGAAGSQYATVPVRVDALLRDGREQHFSGTYTLRRSMVDGTSAEQRRWTIYKASLREH